METIRAPLQIQKFKTALVIIDLQKGIATLPTSPYDSKFVVSNAAKLAEAFRRNNMLVFLVHVKAFSAVDRLKPIADQPMQLPVPPSKDWAEFMPELGPKEGDMIISKKQWGAFYGTDLDLQLRRRGLDTIVLCGISTSKGVESTARFAYEYGYQQIFAEDAMSALAPEEHRNSINTIFVRIGRVRTTQDILDALR